MTVRTVTYLKSLFETGEIPSQNDYGDIFDSFLPIGTSGGYSLDGSMTFTGTVQSSKLDTQTVSAYAVITSAMTMSVLTVSAVGTTQAAAATLTGAINYVNFGNGDNLAVKIPTFSAGRVQHVVNAASTTIKVFPPTGGNFLGTASNANLTIAADQTATILHTSGTTFVLIRGT